jgi:transcriptional regulator with XRE-family HTH domain
VQLIVRTFVGLNFRDQKILDKFSKRLKQLRGERKMSQEELAYSSGLSLSQIARIETAKSNPTLCTIVIIANTLKVNLRELVDF